MPASLRRLPAAVAVAALCLGLAACGGKGGSTYAGAELGVPLAEPPITLTDTSGHAYDLNTATKGRLTLVYFGYTHCPDVCPTTMADLAAAVGMLTPAEQAKVDVVFVTSDPARDTPTVIRAWLNNFSHSFIGLTGNINTIDADAAKLGIALEPPEKQSDGTYEVTHGAQVLAFSPSDEKARIVWLPGTAVAGYVSDMRKLLAT